MNTARQTLTIRNAITEITRVADFIEAFCLESGAGMDAAFKINLAVEEALVNTISYGFADDETHDITIEIGADTTLVEVRIIDDGCPFNPLAQELPNVEAPEDERSVGGLGVFLMRTTMDDVHYERRDGKNRLTLKKNV